MGSKENLARNLRANMKATHRTQKSYARNTGISTSTMLNAVSGKNITLDTLDQIAEGVGIDASELISKVDSRG